MTGSQDSVALRTGSDRLVARASDRSALKALMRRARAWFAHKPSVELAEILGCPVRTAERLFAGDRSPDAVNLWRLMGTKHVAALLDERTREMTPAARAEFWNEIGMAALRAAHREKLIER